MQIGDDRPVRVCKGGQQASIQPVVSIAEECSVPQAPLSAPLSADIGFRRLIASGRHKLIQNIVQVQFLTSALHLSQVQKCAKMARHECPVKGSVITNKTICLATVCRKPISHNITYD